MRSTLVKRLSSGMGANAFGQTVSVALQLLTLPIFLGEWGAEKYGMWLVLSAIPAYFLVADVGITSAAGNHMAVLFARGDIVGADAAFKCAQLVVLIVCTASVLVGGIIGATLIAVDLASYEELAVVGILVAAVQVSFYGGLVDKIYRATGRYATGVTLQNGVRIVEWLGGIVGLYLSGSYIAVACGTLLGRLVSTIWLCVFSRSSSYGFSWAIDPQAFALLKILLRPSAAFAAFPIANALSIQGLTLLVGHALGPTAVTTFTTYRTMARLVVQGVSVLSYSLEPECSRLFGRGAFRQLETLHVKAAWLAAVGACLLSLVVFQASPWLLGLWTKGVVESDSSLATLCFIYAATASCWQVPRAVLVSANGHVQLAQLHIICAALTLAIGMMFLGPLGVSGAGIAMLVPEAILALGAFILATRFVKSLPTS